MGKRLEYILSHIDLLWKQRKMKVVKVELNEVLDNIKLNGDIVL